MDIKNAQESSYIRDLPVGYRFLPTDEELVSHYLINKNFHKPIPAQEVIEEIEATHLYSKPPSSLVTFSCGEREWFFFIHKDDGGGGGGGNEGMRIVGDGIGFWKLNGQEKPICNSDGNVFGFKFHFTYFSGTHPNAKKTHWKMDEYRLPTHTSHQLKGEEWVVGRLKRGIDYNKHI